MNELKDGVYALTSAMSTQSSSTEARYGHSAVVARIDDDQAYVRISGSEIETPALCGVSVKPGDEVIVCHNEDRTATITANMTEPPNYSVSLANAGVDIDGNEFVELAPTGNTGGDGNGRSYLRLSLEDGLIVINGIRMLELLGRTSSRPTPGVRVAGIFNAEEISGHWLNLSQNAFIDFRGDATIKMSKPTVGDLSYDISARDDGLHVVCQNGYHDADDMYQSEESCEVIIGLDAAGLNIKATKVNIEGALSVNGKEIITKEASDV